jgi:hypothetical protein
MLGNRPTANRSVSREELKKRSDKNIGKGEDMRTETQKRKIGTEGPCLTQPFIVDVSMRSVAASSEEGTLQ